METTSSSKVTVEYFDPSNVFPLVSPSLLSRLPLRNLHWKSPSRPLRSIASIHVDLIPYDQSLQNGKESPESSKSDSTGDRGDTSRPSTAREQKAAQNEIAAGPSKGSTKERRHQIPGLRQNPYLKIYLLRCDDNDSYKASSRKLVREWIREHTPGPQTTSSSSNQENHDAFEWLIVHVVLPHTGASAQPRSSGNAGGAGGNEKSQSSSRWPGRGSSTILEKIKADFNGSSKSAVDRVAQIRLHKTDIPPHLLPEPSGVAYQDDDEEGAWTDLISKFKSLILTSFDLRVAQYEEDIREKDAQRSLPGWNFCTFFVLKEGLARGFESVGLVEDALVGYDELSAGLDAIAQDQASEHGADSQGGTFREFTEELWHDFKALREVQNRKRQQRSAEDRQKDQRAEAPGGLSRTSPLSVTNKKYRNLILSSNISVFDFRCYIFARQMSLLLRLANASSSRRELMAKLNAQPGVTEADFSTSEDQAPSPLRHFDEQEDLLMLAEICNRGANFITSVARIMRIDLWSACSHLKSADFESNEQPPPSRDATVERSETAQLIDYLVSFWTFSVCQQILAETSTSNLPNAFPETNKSSGKASVSGQGVQEPKTVISEPKTMIHPKRSSSLQAQPRDKERVGTFEHQQKSILSKLGMQELASSRAELWLIEKSTAEQLGRRRNWRLGWRDLSPTEPIQVKDMEDIKLDTSSTTSEVPLQHDEHHVDLSGIGNATLESALQDERSFGNLVEGLLEKILHHFEMANRRRSIAKATVELAILKFYRQDFAAAAAYFGKMIQIYAHENWDDVELTMLKMYAQCLKNLDRREDYVHIALEILAKVADKGKFSEAGHSGKSLDQAGDSTGLGLKPDEEDGMISITEYLSDLFAYSEHLSQELKIPLSRYFDGAQVDRCPRLYQDKDGVELLFKLRHLFPADLKIDRVRVKLASSVPGREIWLESNGTQTFKCGVSRIWLGTNSSSPESFYVEQILVIARNVTFIHETLPAAARSSSLDSLATNLVTTSMKVRSSLIRLFPRPEALEAKLRLSRRIHLAKPRSVELTIATGGNRVSTGELRMKSASAGLRLKLSEAKIVAGAMTGFSSSRPGIIEFGELQPQTWLRFQIPYLLEHDLAELFVRIEVAYTTEKGEFLFSRNSRVSVMLPLGVNVQDVFKKEALFSKFTVSTASAVPLRVFRSDLKGSNLFNVRSGGVLGSSMFIFPKQPAQLLHKIIRRDKPMSPEDTSTEEKTLALSIQYNCFDEEIMAVSESTFEAYILRSPHRDLLRRLSSFFVSHIQDRLGPDVLEAAALRGDFKIGSFEEVGWSAALDDLPPASAKEVLDCLVEFHKNHPTIDLADIQVSDLTREITIPVDVPNVQVLHTVDLCVLGFDPDTSSNPRIAAVGQMLPAELRIAHTRTWDQDQMHNAATPPDWDDAIEFNYEIHANPDSWIIGGRRRSKFAAKAQELLTFPVMLIPLKPGHLLLPSIDIAPVVAWSGPPGPNDAPSSHEFSGITSHPRASLSVSSDEKRSSFLSESRGGISRDYAAPVKPPLACEVQCRSQAQSILVLPNVRSATVSLDYLTPEGGASLVASERRVDEVS